MKYRNLGVVLLLFIFQLTAFSQQKETRIKTALLIVDIQDFYFPGERPGLVNVEFASKKAKETLQLFREKEELVVHVRHKANKGFDIHKNVTPLVGEKVITKEEVNSFYKTDLLEYLNKNSVNRLVVIGMQTHMCLEAAVRAAHDFGFECVVIQDACATRDITFKDNTVKAEDVHYSTLATLKSGGYAEVIELIDFSENIDKYLHLKLD